MNVHPCSRRHLLGVAIVFALLPALVRAADDNPPASASPSAKLMPTVTVTGSHLRRSQRETAQPVLVLDRSDLLKTGLTNLGDILQQLPIHGSAINSDWNNASEGAGGGIRGETRVSLRSLGSNRTLVLLNGRRFVTSIDGGIDVATIPVAIVQRVEILTDGASAIYGSDAIAGVVNIITRDHFDGAELNAHYATSEYGDGQRRTVDGTWGHQGDRGGIAINLNVDDQKPIMAGDRAISAVPIFGLPANDSANGLGASRGGPNGRFGFGPFGNRLPNGSKGQLTWDPTLGDYRVFDPHADGYNFAPQNYLRTPYRRLTAFVTAYRDLGADTTFHANLLVHHRDSQQQLAPKILGWNADFADEISADNAFNTFGQPVTFFQFRPLIRPRVFDENVTTAYLSLSLDGVLNLGQRPFDWQLGLIAGRSNERDSITGGVNLQHLGLGLGPTFVDGGSLRCGTLAAPISGCVPLDILHGQNGFTDAMYDYVTANAAVRQTRSLRDLNLGISGTIFALPAGPARLAAGLEYRSEHADVRLDPLLTDQTFDFGGAAYQPVSGRSRIGEGYVELSLPLLKNQRFAHALDLDLAARYSHYDNFGSTTNPKAMLSWRPTADWLVRGAWSTGFRAPSMDEMYSSITAKQAGVDFLAFDPCVVDFTGVVATRCRAAGVPAGGIDPLAGPVILSGSNPTLQPERSRNRSLGVVWSPHAIAGLDASLDWWHIDLRDTIDAIGADYLLDLCYEQGIASACQYQSRDPATGWLTSVDARLHNNGRFSLEGYDLGIGYRRQTRLGEFRLRWDTSYLTRFVVELPKGAPPVSTAGLYDNPGDVTWRWRSVLSLDWQRDRWGAGARWRYFSALHEDCSWFVYSGYSNLCSAAPPDPRLGGDPIHVIGARTYTDLYLSWKPNTHMALRLGVNNAFNLAPPVAITTANSFDPSYDVPGRFWYADWQYTF